MTMTVNFVILPIIQNWIASYVKLWLMTKHYLVK